MGATWTGSISLAGFPIGVALHERAGRKAGRGFKMIDPKHKQPVRQQYVDIDGEPVERSETLRGVEHGGGIYPLEPETVEAIDQLGAKSTVAEIASFAPADTVPVHLALDSYTVTPEGGDEPLGVLWNGLRAGKLAALVERWCSRTGSRPSLLAIMATTDGLIAYRLPFAHEINATPSWAPKRDRKASALFGQFIETAYSVRAFEISDYADDHEQLREQAITQALAGEPVTTTSVGPQPAAPVIDLMAALAARVGQQTKRAA